MSQGPLLFHPDTKSSATILSRDLFTQVREQFAQRHGESVANLWFRSLRLLSFRRGVVTLGVANELVKDYLERRYRESLEELFASLTGSPLSVQFRIDDYLHRAVKTTAAGEPSSAPAAEGGEPQEVAAGYVVRPENRTCYAALKRSMLEAAPVFNPIFIHGPPGSGKTALLSWYLGAMDRERGPVSRFSATGDEFTQRFTRGIRAGTPASFRGEVLAHEMLIVDEVHRLADRLATQRELLSIFKYFLERGRQVIFLSRHGPRDILHLDVSLRSHFLSGMVLGIAELSLPSHVAILEQHASYFRRPFPTAVIEQLAGRVAGGLKGELSLLRKVAGLAALRHTEVTPAFLHENFPELGDRAPPDDIVQRIVEQVCRALQVSREDLLSGRKTRRTAVARHIAIYLASRVFGLSSRRIGRSLGTLSPSVVPYAKQRVEALRREDPGIDQLIRKLRDEVGAEGQQFLPWG